MRMASAASVAVMAEESASVMHPAMKELIPQG